MKRNERGARRWTPRFSYNPLQTMSSLSIYILGFLLLVSGLSAAMYLAGVPAPWIVAAAICLAGVGVISGVGRTRNRDSSPVE